MFVIRAVIVASLVVLVSVSIRAQAAVDSDLKEIQSYKLSLPVMKQVMVATKNIMAAIPSDPRFQRAEKLKAELKTLEEKEEPTDADLQRMEKLGMEIDAIEDGANILGGNKSLDEMEAAARQEPLFENAVKSAGLTVREYAKFMAALLQASMISGFQKAGMIKELPKDANPENVKFVEQYAKEMEGFKKEMEALGKKQQ